MASEGHANLSRASEPEDQAFKEGQARLDELVRQLVDTESDVKERLYRLVEDYKAVCRRTVEQRAQIIQDVSIKNAQAGRYLENEPRFHVPVPERAMWVHKGVLITYMPDDDDTPPPEPEESQALGSPGIEDQKMQQRLLVPPPEAERTLASTSRSAPEPIPQYSTRLVYSGKKPVTMSFAKDHWIFEYVFKGGIYLFVLRCPKKNCRDPIFSRNPLRNNRGFKHFKAHGYCVPSERDMVRRYAEQVLPDRKDREVTLKWAWKHNFKLLGYDEKLLEEENL